MCNKYFNLPAITINTVLFISFIPLILILANYLFFIKIIISLEIHKIALIITEILIVITK